MTFDDSDRTKLDTRAGSLALGWSGVSLIGKGGDSKARVFETNAAVCVAGAGALPTTGNGVVENANKDLVGSGADVSLSLVHHGIELRKGDDEQARVCFPFLWLVPVSCKIKGGGGVNRTRASEKESGEVAARVLLKYAP